MSHEPFETQAAVYALGALDGEERSEFEEHLAGGCVACAEAVREYVETLADAARGAPPMGSRVTAKTSAGARVGAIGCVARPDASTVNTPAGRGCPPRIVHSS